MARDRNVPTPTGERSAAASDGRSKPGMRPLALSWSDWFVIAAIALACGLTAFAGIPELREFEHDIFFALPNGYRVSHGQIPYRDFASAYGPVFFLIEAAGLAISGMRPAGVAYANAIFGAAIALWTYLLVRKRLAPASACTLGVYAALLITAPFALGYNPLALCYAMGYNRYGYALLGIILLECGLQALQTAGPGTRGAGRALLAGVAWALLAFLKITYAMAAVPFLLLWVWCGSGRGRRFAALCGGFGIVAAILICYLRFDLADMFRDLAAAARGGSLAWKPVSILSPSVAIESIPLLLLATVLTVRTGQSSSVDVSRWRARLWLFVLLTVGAGGFLLSTNHQPMSLPLDGFAAVVLMDATRAQPDRKRRLVAGFLGGLCFLPLMMMNATSLTAASWERYRGPQPAGVRLRAERGASIIFGPVESSMTSETGGSAYVDVLNDGLRLIRTRTEAGEGVATMDTYNPFNYLLDRPSPRGGIAAAFYNYAFSDSAHPSADRFFGEARYVLVRKYSKTVQDFPIEEPHIEGIIRTYRPALEQRFVPVEETTHWTLWRRK